MSARHKVPQRGSTQLWPFAYCECNMLLRHSTCPAHTSNALVHTRTCRAAASSPVPAPSPHLRTCPPCPRRVCPMSAVAAWTMLTSTPTLWMRTACPWCTTRPRLRSSGASGQESWLEGGHASQPSQVRGRAGSRLGTAAVEGMQPVHRQAALPALTTVCQSNSCPCAAGEIRLLQSWCCWLCSRVVMPVFMAPAAPWLTKLANAVLQGKLVDRQVSGCTCLM